MVQEYQGSGETVLMVEDDPFMRDFGVLCLQKLDYKVVTALDGPGALALLREGLQPDLLFTDITMPGGMSGFDLARRAREIQPHIRVLFTSGRPLEAMSGEEQKEAGSILSKPYRKVDLARCVKEAMGRQLPPLEGGAGGGVPSMRNEF